MKIGIIGTGPMAHKFTETLICLKEEVCLWSIASRDINKAEIFKNEYGFEKAYGSYDELIQDKDVELIYIAIPHSEHMNVMKKCIAYHKAILCEKPITVNSKDAKEIKELANKENVFLAEAMWPRYMPSRNIINEVLNSDVIGKVNIINANLCYPIYTRDRLMNPHKAGGALLDLGVYGLTFAFSYFGSDYEKIETSMKLTDSGVDGMENITLFYKDNRMVNLTHSIYSHSERKAMFYGEKGYMIVEDMINPQSVDVYDVKNHLIKHCDIPKQISGYEYEVLECIKCIKEGKKETYSLPLSDSIKVMEACDEIRKQWNLKYPFEND